jgi:hypothetical protein
VEKAIIRWPSGVTQQIPEPASGKLHHVKEPK